MNNPSATTFQVSNETTSSMASVPFDSSVRSARTIAETGIPAKAISSSAISAALDLEALKRTIQTLVGPQIVETERQIAKAITSQFSEVQHLSNQAGALAGKRLRPILVWLSAQACECYISDAKLDAELAKIAASVELVHMASLVHDDVMDQADTRRHQTTVYRLSGTNAAVLLGDFLFTRAYAVAASCKGTHPARRIARAATDLCEGELRQQLSASNWNLSSREYFGILNQKTASLCSVSCQLGAWRSGSSLAHQRLLAKFGRYLGLAFQIFDDWLDYWGDESVGKTLGTDLAQLKPTLPLLHYLNTASTSERQRFLAKLQSQKSEDLRWATETIRSSDAGDATMIVARRFAQKAIALIDSLPDSEARSLLKGLALFSVSRAS